MTDDRRPMTETFTLRLPSRTTVLRLFPYAIILVAFFLRVYRLPDKNIWWDEGWSVWLSQKDLAWIALRTAMDEHPPLHYWFLHFWNFIAGTDVFAGRFISVAFGVLTIALIYRLGKKVGGAWIGILAALFLTVARFHIWWSQDIKNYTPSIFFAFAAVWFALEILEEYFLPQSTQRSQRKNVVFYALCAALAMWTHYLAALVLLALNLYVLILFTFYALRSSPLTSRLTRSWLIANLLAALFFAPWLYLYLQNAAEWTAAPTFDFVLFLKLVATVLPLGVTTNIDHYAALTIALTTITALGCIPQKAESRKQKAEDTNCLLPALIVAFPPLLVYALALTPVSFFAPKIQARYLLILLPAYTILLALGVALLRRFSLWLALAATIFVLGANAVVLNDYYAERRLTDEYTTLANTINAFARQGDVVLLHTDQEWPTFLYYLRYPLDWLGVPNGKAMTEADAAALVRRALNRHNAIWLITIPDALATDPGKLLMSRLRRELPHRFDLASSYGDKQLFLFTRDDRDLVQVDEANLQIQHSLPAVVFQDAANGQQQFQLLGFDMPVREVRAGDPVPVVTYWNATSPIKSELQIVDPAGRITSAPEFYLPAGKNVRVHAGGIMPPDAGGNYAIRVRIGTKTVELARIGVIPTSGQRTEGALLGFISNAHPMDYRFGDSIHLLGFNELAKEFRAGESVPLGLIWRTDRPVDKSYKVFIHLLGNEWNPAQDNFLWGQVDRVPRGGLYPTSAWRAGETIVDINGVVINRNAPTGLYKIEVGLYDPATGERLPVSNGGDSVVIAEIQVVAR